MNLMIGIGLPAFVKSSAGQSGRKPPNLVRPLQKIYHAAGEL